jgi:tRNA(Ile)-lysidine synthase
MNCNNIENRIKNYIAKYQLFSPDSKLLIALSGGPDSVCLLNILKKLYPSQQIMTVHIDHCLRENSPEDAIFSMTISADFNILDCIIVKVDVDAFANNNSLSTEEAARILRYEAFNNIANELDCDYIVTAHNKDDQAETVLMRILRGTGIDGLVGIPVKRNNIIRPMLCLTKEEILYYLHEKSIKYCVDETNAINIYTRNKIRNELIPILSNYNPDVKDALCRLSELAANDNNLLTEIAKEEYDKSSSQLPDGIKLIINQYLHPGIYTRIFRMAVYDIKGNKEDFEFDHQQQILQLTNHSGADFPGLRVEKHNDSYHFLKLNSEIDIYEHKLKIGSKLILPGIGIISSGEYDNSLSSSNIAIIDSNLINGNLTVRGWLNGDRFQPFGMSGHKTLQDIFIDSHVIRRLRSKIPVICDSDGIIWLAGYRIADRVKYTNNTTKKIYIRIEWEFNPWIP